MKNMDYVDCFICRKSTIVCKSIYQAQGGFVLMGFQSIQLA